MVSNKGNDGSCQFCQFYHDHCTRFDFCLRMKRRFDRMDMRECCMDLNHAIANEIESIPIDVVSLKALGLRDLSELVRLLVRPFIVCLSVFSV